VNSSTETTTPSLIGVSGRRRSGKDTFAGHLIEKFDFQRVAFADLLRNTLLDTDPYVSSPHGDTELLSVLLAECGGWEGLKNNPDWSGDTRRLMQNLGVSVRNNIGSSTWVDAAMAHISKICDAGGRVVVTDMRFPNEVESIRAAGGLIVRINRPSLRLDTGSALDLHVSEALLDDPELLRPNLTLESDPFDTFPARAISALAGVSFTRR
jgi:hypothetical protein